LSTSISSLVMGALTISWFHYSEVKQYVDIQPASIAFINVWKTSSYFASVLTALLVVIAHSVGSSLFPEAALTAVLPVSWVFVIVVSFIYFRHWNIKYHHRLSNESRLITYPFLCRDILLKSDIQDVVLAQYSLRHLNQDTISFSSSIDHFRDQPPLSFLLAEIWCQEQERNK
jgi:hypothetical protein